MWKETLLKGALQNGYSIWILQIALEIFSHRMYSISTIISLRCAIHVFHCRNSHSILFHNELMVTQSIKGIQESNWKLLPKNICPIAHSPALLKKWRWRTTPKLHAETTFQSLYKLGSFGNSGLCNFSENTFLEKHSVSLFWKPTAQKPFFPTQTLLIKARTGASWVSKWEGQPGISSLSATKFKFYIKCRWSIKLDEDVTHINMFHSICSIYLIDTPAVEDLCCNEKRLVDDWFHTGLSLGT